MRRLLLLIVAVSFPALAGPTSVEAGGYTLLPKLTLGPPGTFAGLANGELKIFGTSTVVPFMYLSSQEPAFDSTAQSSGLIFWGNRTYGFSWVLGGKPATGIDAKSFVLTDGNTNHLQFRVPNGGNNDSRVYFESQGVSVSTDAQYMFKHTLAFLAPGVAANIPTMTIKGADGSANQTGDILNLDTNAGSVMVGVTLAGNVYSNATSSNNAYSLLQGAKLTFDGTTGAKYLSSDGSTLTLTGLSMTMSGQFIMPAHINIKWGVTGSDSLSNGAGNYTGVSRGLPDGTVWPIPATVFHTGTVGANTSTTETTLVQATHTNQFGNDADVNGRGFCVSASGNFAANANAKTIKLKYGATQTDATGGLFTGTAATNGGSWVLDCRIVQLTSASTQHTTCRMETSSATAGVFVNVTTGAENFATLDWNMTLTGTGGATNDITNALMRVDFCP